MTVPTKAKILYAKVPVLNFSMFYGEEWIESCSPVISLPVVQNIIALEGVVLVHLLKVINDHP